eukprot:COSAG02_NODE_7185_length_3132_cov_4.251566_2_plen_432_part_00
MNHLAAKQRANDLANGAGRLDGFGIGGRAVPRAGMRQLPGGNKGHVPRAANRPSGVLQDARTRLDGIGLPSIGATGSGGGRQQPRVGSGRRARGQSHSGQQQHGVRGSARAHPRSAGALGQPSGRMPGMDGMDALGIGGMHLDRPISGPSGTGRPSSRPSSESGAMRRPRRNQTAGGPQGAEGISEQQFVPSVAFQGPKVGFVFKNGDRGVGYYADPSAAPPPAPSESLAAGGSGAEITVEFGRQGKLGLAFVHGSAPLVIESITKGGAASKELQLHPGLILISANWQSVVGLTHEQTVRLLKSAERPLVLGFERQQSDRQPSRGSSVSSGLEATTELLTASADVNVEAKPKKMVRCKTWDENVEAAFRYQSAGWRDTREYLAANGEVTVWAGTTWPKCLQIKGGEDRCYFGKKRECASSLIPRVKLFSYE